MIGARPIVFIAIADIHHHQYIFIFRQAKNFDDLIRIDTVDPKAVESFIGRCQNHVGCNDRGIFPAGIDTFTWDNVKVDPDGNLWFVDNGASFDFRACGKRGRGNDR